MKDRIIQVNTAGLFLACLLSASAIASAQQDRSENLRALNARILQFHASLRRADPTQMARIRADIAPVFAQRAAALKDLIREAPGAALGLAFSQDLLDDLAARFPASAGLLEKHGTWQGQSQHIVLDDPARQVRQFQVQMRAGNETLQVYSAEGEPHCVSGNTLSATGVRVENFVAAGSTSVQEAEVAAAAGCSTLGAQNAAILLVQFPTIPLPTGVTKSGVWDIFFASSGRSVDGYWKEASYGKASATGNVFGPYTLDRTYTCDEYYSMLGAAITAADPDVNFPSYTRIFVVFPNPGTCSFAGMGMMGCSTFTSADGDFTASAAWLLASYMTSRDSGVKLATHEGGHNLTLNHSSSRAYTGEALGPVGATGTLAEYGDVFATMGSWNLGHYAAQHKVQMGWLPAANLITTETNGSYGIQPLETATAGVQAVKVRRGAGNDAWLWVEYRQPVGQYDNSLSGIFSGGLIHYQDSTTGAYTHLLDFSPSTTNTFGDPVLTGTWVDPYTNLSLSVTGANSSALSLNVSYGAPPCAVVQPTVTLSPANPSANSGASVSYTVSVKNNDASGCSSSTFSLNSALPSGWSTSFSPAALTLSPGQTATAAMTKSIPAGFTPGTYGVNATASNASHSTTGTANVTVTAPSCSVVQPTVTLSPGAANAISGTAVSYTVSVTNNDTAVCTSSTFALTSTVPSGWPTSFSPGTLTLIPGQTATATMTTTIPAAFTPGPYSVSATLSDANHSTTGSASVTVSAPPQPLQLTVSATPATVKARDTVTIRGTVTNANGPVSGASVTFTLTRPNGPVTQAATTNSSGVATWMYKAQQKGNYSVTAATTSNGASATSSAATFTVQ